MEKLIQNSDQSSSLSYYIEHNQQKEHHKSSEIEGGSVMIDNSAVECMERLMLSEPAQKLERCLNTNWQQLEMLVAILQQTPIDKSEDIFNLYQDPKQNNRIVLAETQFNLIRKVYTRCYINNKFSLNDDQLIIQFFMNLKALHQRIQKQESIKSSRKQ
ncbi:UNKNOWN [Stylonychia lemnae]|uniref:Uncharacterized protein n=1 Tax=Stylonychia lemnae TaxID=5949 RepID=A0A078ABT0_STYLE|nr:UNKNOWN [Stylonychia lemnae]|eukprot:CDW78238.1 UNKNOWN [Stylonychia lemnae]